MTVVVDASLWVLQAQPHDPRQASAQAILPRLLGEMPVCAPVLLGYELAQVLFHKQVDPDEPLSFRLRRVRNLLSDIRLVESEWDRIGYVADKYEISAYDAAYLELAQRLGAVLATEDDQLQKAGVKALGASQSLRLKQLATLVR